MSMNTTDASEAKPCQWCDSYHTGNCPNVKAIEYHPNGTLKRIEFMTPADAVQYVVQRPHEDITVPYVYPGTTWVANN